MASTLLLCGCPSSVVKPSCITAPFDNVKEQRALVFEIGGELDKLDIDAELKNKFESSLEVHFPKLSDENTALLLFLRAISCYVDSADTPEKVAIVTPLVSEMAAIVRQRYGEAVELQGADPSRLTESEREEIDRSQYATQIYELYREFGLL